MNKIYLAGFKVKSAAVLLGSSASTVPNPEPQLHFCTQMSD